MSEEVDNKKREFLRTAGRTAVIGLLSVGVGGLLLRRDSKCTGSFVCRQCGSLDECKLPQAEIAWQEIKKEYNGR
ncbi:MAG: hypothetical protein WCJ56_06215 [bacterium]